MPESEIMLNDILKYLTVYFSSMVKFIGGPVLGYATGLSFLETIIFNVLGMMTTVFIVSFVGRKIKLALFKKRKRKLFTTRNRRLVSVWRKWGLIGIAFLTPLIFSPIVGASVAASFGEKTGKIAFYMLLSALFWSVTYTVFFFKIAHLFELNISL